MRVCVVGVGWARARPRRRARSDRRRRGARPATPGIPDSTAHAAGRDRRRPVRDRSRGSARRRPGRPPAGAGQAVFGPGADGARLEGSKAWMKEVLDEAGVPTARHGAFTDLEPALGVPRHDARPLRGQDRRAGRGQGRVRHRVARRSARRRAAKLSGASFGDAGRRVVIEEGLTGPELSVLAICDGETACATGARTGLQAGRRRRRRAQHGRDGRVLTGAPRGSTVVDEVVDRCVEPTLRALRTRGASTTAGVLYAGLMLTPAGPRSSSSTCASATPRRRSCCPALRVDLDGAARRGRRRDDCAHESAFVDDAAVTVVCAAEGYPGADRAPATSSTGSTRPARSTASPSTAPASAPARRRAAGHRGRPGAERDGTGADDRRRRGAGLRGRRAISWPGMQFRTDIAARAANKEP